MRNIKQWMMAIVALAGFNGALPHAQAQAALSTPHDNDSLDIVSVDVNAFPEPDGRTIP